MRNRYNWNSLTILGIKKYMFSAIRKNVVEIILKIYGGLKKTTSGG
jgi:hypothetical protein